MSLKGVIQMLLDVMCSIPRWFKSKVFGKDKLAIKGLRPDRPAILGDPFTQPVPVMTWMDKMLKRFYTFRFVDTNRGGHNMPKYQPCPECTRSSHRDHKIDTGAIYRCGNHGEFLVKG